MRKLSYKTMDALEIIGLVLFSIIAFTVVIGIIAAISAAVLMWAWNVFVPAIFGLPKVTFLQSFALVFLLEAVGGLLKHRSSGKKDQ